MGSATLLRPKPSGIATKVPAWNQRA